MKRMITILIPFLAGFLLYSAWAGFVEKEFTYTEYKGYIINKVQSDQVIEVGSSIITQPLYKVVFSNGKELSVPYAIYKQLHKGDHKVLIKQKENLIIIK
ncbi:hypothetical protein KUV80_04155 [Fictibacillus nanhaiensis]|uniref:hypothetical protein n=1 Tax=Fictibacillus nanhaiensis TaxID=742169 RepID=UPI001C937529|nr:hypothetical protein [Fictibacillus nanhaiensis]MBY6035828.1 hypothetical protein [Fictibacillus nanhaiensis]